MLYQLDILMEKSESWIPYFTSSAQLVPIDSRSKCEQNSKIFRRKQNALYNLRVGWDFWNGTQEVLIIKGKMINFSTW